MCIICEVFLVIRTIKNLVERMPIGGGCKIFTFGQVKIGFGKGKFREFCFCLSIAILVL